jgi:hypothetical protein
LIAAADGPPAVDDEQDRLLGVQAAVDEVIGRRWPQ